MYELIHGGGEKVGLQVNIYKKGYYKCAVNGNRYCNDLIQLNSFSIGWLATCFYTFNAIYEYFLCVNKINIFYLSMLCKKM
jgi:hypothetical protein